MLTVGQKVAIIRPAGKGRENRQMRGITSSVQRTTCRSGDCRDCTEIRAMAHILESAARHLVLVSELIDHYRPSCRSSTCRFVGHYLRHPEPVIPILEPTTRKEFDSRR